jgi:hypothetical protein
LTTSFGIPGKVRNTLGFFASQTLWIRLHIQDLGGIKGTTLTECALNIRHTGIGTAKAGKIKFCILSIDHGIAAGRRRSHSGFNDAATVSQTVQLRIHIANGSCASGTQRTLSRNRYGHYKPGKQVQYNLHLLLLSITS